MRPAAVVVPAAILAAGLAGLELFARHLEASRMALDYSARHMGPVAWSLAAFRPSLEYGYEPEPGGGHNALGFRNQDYEPRKRPGVFRVLLAGDSLAWLYGDALQRELQERLPGRAVEVWNAGVGGYNLLQYGMRMRRLGLPYRPDLVVVFVCLNDASGDIPVVLRTGDRFYTARFGHAPQLSALPGASLLWHRSAAYRLAALGIMRRMYLATSHDDGPLAGAELREMRRAAEGAGAPIAAVVFPYLVPEREYPPGSIEAQGRALLPRLLQETGIPFLDLAPLTPDRERRSLRLSPGDPIHLSEKGARRAMSRIGEWLQARRFLPR